MSDLVIETTGLRKEFRSLRGERAGRRTETSTWRCRPAGCTASSGPTAPARPRPSGCCSGWPGRPAARMRLFGQPVPAAPAAGDRPGRRGRRVPEVLAELQRSPQPPAARRRHRRADAAVDAAIETVKLGRPREGPLQGLLARHEAAARDRGDAAQGSRPADPRRADQRPRPGRHPRDPRDDPRPRRLRCDGAAELAHPGRGPAGLHRRPPSSATASCWPRAPSTSCSAPVRRTACWSRTRPPPPRS